MQWQENIKNLFRNTNNPEKEQFNVIFTDQYPLPMNFSSKHFALDNRYVGQKAFMLKCNF